MRRPLVPISLIEICRLVDLGWIDSTKLIDLPTLIGTKKLRLRDEVGFMLTSEVSWERERRLFNFWIITWLALSHVFLSFSRVDNINLWISWCDLDGPMALCISAYGKVIGMLFSIYSTSFGSAIYGSRDYWCNRERRRKYPSSLLRCYLT